MVRTGSFSGIFTLFSAAGDAANRGMKILFCILGIIPGLAILPYLIYGALILPFIFIILVGVWALILRGIPLSQGLNGGGGGVRFLGLLSVIISLIILVHPYVATLALPFVLGVFGIIFGFAAILGAFMMRSAEKAA